MISIRLRRRWYEWHAKLGFHGWRHGSAQHWLQYMVRASLQFWLPQNHDQEFMARGAFSNYLWIDTARGFTVAQFGTPPPRDALSGAEHAAAMRALGDAVTGQDAN